MKRYSGIWEILKIILAVFLAAAILRTFIFQPFIVEGNSMQPNYQNGEYVMIEKISYHFHQPRRGDVIVFEYPNDTRVDYIKRVIGLPGETVRIENGQVFINNNLITESYLSPGQQTTVNGSSSTPYVVQLNKDEFFVMGDNRDHSADSREGWVVNSNLIIGKAALILYPRAEAQTITTPKY